MNLTFGEFRHANLGPISMVAGDYGLLKVGFQPLQEFKNQPGYLGSSPSLVGLEVVGTLLTELNEYLFGIRKDFSVLIDWDSLSGFQREVLELTANIPYGQWATYGELAKQLGKPGGARAVGHALGTNPMPIVIPCHRVLGAGGELRGYINGVDAKAFLLDLEGHQIKNDRLI